MARYRRRESRLVRMEKKRFRRQTILITAATFLLVGVVIFYGIPAIIRMAVFLGELRYKSLPIEKDDVIPPSAPVMQPLPEATFSGQIKIDGYAESGATVIVMRNGKQVVETVVENDGKFLVDNLVLEQGENEIFAVAIDNSQNESQRSIVYTVIYDNVAPELSINQPNEGQNFYGALKRNISVIGKTESGASVSVNGRLAYVNQDGDFSTNINLDKGENRIKVVALDKAGNETVKELKVNYFE